ncbi:MAG: S8 family serine peptidase [Deltaproteobacteria bacterium]|nr:S8 family serine peptidase [Deltaproteobacteria bacterium]
MLPWNDVGRAWHPAWGGALLGGSIGLAACAVAERDAVPPAGRARVKIDPAVSAGLREHERERVIVELDDPYGADREPASPAMKPRGAERERLRRLRQADLGARKARVLAALERATGRPARVVHQYPAFRLLCLEADAGEVAALAGAAEVVRVHADAKEGPDLAQSLPFIYAPEFQQSFGAGAKTAVAVLDSPVRYENGSFGSCPEAGAPGCSVAVRLSFAEESCSQVMAKEDAYGKNSHGTNVAAIALGVAPETTLLSLNVFHSDDEAKDIRSNVSDQIAALDWVAENAASYGIVAANLSLGKVRDDPLPCNDVARYDPIRTLFADHGILTTISSGNDGKQNGVSEPGCISLALTAAAQLDTDVAPYLGSCKQYFANPGEIACFSNLSGMLDLVAPGVRIEAGKITMSGTSMAAPHLAGAVAAWQSFFLAQQGEPEDAAWMARRLLADSSEPLVHTDGRHFSQLKLDRGFAWSWAQGFPWFYREVDDGLIPSGAPGQQQTLAVEGKGWKVAGAYLYLDVAHPSPQNVEVGIKSPSGKGATVKLPGGQASFNGIIGRMVLPGAFAAVAGSPVDGTWTLTLRDTKQASQGHYLQAALFFAKQGCTPSCAGVGCGDDGCGWSCGALCLIDGACRVKGETAPGDACSGCEPDQSSFQWSPLDGTPCDDGDGCTSADTCVAGACQGVEKPCPPPAACHGPGACEPESGQCAYPKLADGEACDDGEPCTVGDACTGGECRGALKPCVAPAECQQAGICDAQSGACVYAAAPDGTPCSVGACSGGACRMAAPPPAPAPVAPEDQGGCGCRAAGRAGSGAGGLLLTLLGAALGRRRRRRPEA